MNKLYTLINDYEIPRMDEGKNSLMQRTPDPILEIAILGILIGIFASFVNVIFGVIIGLIIPFFIWFRLDQNNVLLSELILYLSKQIEKGEQV